MSELGQKRRFNGAPLTSGLPPLADIFSDRGHVSKVPDSDSCTAANKALFDHLVGAGEQRGRYIKA